jgi:hypothetical protein
MVIYFKVTTINTVHIILPYIFKMNFNIIFAN